MKPTLNVYALPKFVEPAELAGAAAVVIDVLRSTTTIVYALDAGADEVVACLEVADALALAKRYPADRVVLGGERHGSRIEGFQLGNSPEEYTPDRVGGKTVLLTTTNGTRAMAHARQADEAFVAAFVNVSAVVRQLLDREHVNILCAGTDGEISEDDVLLAGLLVERLQRQGGMIYQQNAQAITARESWLHAFTLPQALGADTGKGDSPIFADTKIGTVPKPERLGEKLCKSLGAKNLIALGLEADIFAAAQIDRFDLAPRLDPKTLRIRI